MQIDYDREADAIYVRFREAETDHTIEVSRYIHLDVDRDDMPLGLEILFARQVLGKQGVPSVTVNVTNYTNSDEFEQ